MKNIIRLIGLCLTASLLAFFRFLLRGKDG